MRLQNQTLQTRTADLAGERAAVEAAAARAAMGRMPSGRRRSMGAARFLIGCLLASCVAATVEPEPVVEPAGPLDLAAAVELALANHPDARIAREHVRRADQLVGDARSLLWPEVSAGIGASRTDRPSQVFGSVLDQGAFESSIDFNDPGVRTNVRPELAARATLYDGGRRRAHIDEALAERDATRATSVEVAGVVAFETARAWHAVHAAERAARSADAGALQLARELEVARVESELGARRSDSVAALAVELTHARDRAETLHASVRRARSGLAVLLGLGVEHDFELTAPTLADAPPLDELATLLERARFARPELVGAQAGIEAALARVRGAEAGYLPELSLFGTLGIDGAQNGLDHSNWLFGVDLVSSITDALRTPSRVRAAVSDLVVAHESGRRVLLAVESEVESAWLDANAADRGLTIARADQDYLQDLAARAEAEGEFGARREVDLERARTAVLLADNDVATARLRCALSRIALLHAVGEFPPRATPSSEQDQPR